MNDNKKTTEEILKRIAELEESGHRDEDNAEQAELVFQLGGTLKYLELFGE